MAGELSITFGGETITFDSVQAAGPAGNVEVNQTPGGGVNQGPPLAQRFQARVELHAEDETGIIEQINAFRSLKGRVVNIDHRTQRDRTLAWIIDSVQVEDPTNADNTGIVATFSATENIVPSVPAVGEIQIIAPEPPPPVELEVAPLDAIAALLPNVVLPTDVPNSGADSPLAPKNKTKKRTSTLRPEVRDFFDNVGQFVMETDTAKFLRNVDNVAKETVDELSDITEKVGNVLFEQSVVSDAAISIWNDTKDFGSATKKKASESRVGRFVRSFL